MMTQRTYDFIYFFESFVIQVLPTFMILLLHHKAFKSRTIRQTEIETETNEDEACNIIHANNLIYLTTAQDNNDAL